MLKLLSFLLFILSTTVSAAECLVAHHIFLIHGIGGSSKTFGSMEKYLNKQDPCYKTSSFEYDTGNSLLNTYDFSESFDRHIKKRISKGEIAPQDKISLIMHSQGGIVGSLWMNKASQTDPEIFAQIDSFITLSTPYWGADMAKLGKTIFYSLPEGTNNPISPFGRQELNEMSYGSRTIRDLSFIYKRVFPYRALRALAIGGVHRKLGNIIDESDVAVPIYSSRPDHYELHYNVSPFQALDYIGEEQFIKTESIPFVSVAAAHIKLDMPGVADLPRRCVKNKKCDHPSIDLIMDHLQGRDIKNDQTTFKNFRIQLYVNNLAAFGMTEDDVSLKVLETNNVSLHRQKTSRAPASLKEDSAFTLEGETSSGGNQQMRVIVTIGHIDRVIQVPVEGGHSTLVNLTVK